MQIRNISDRTIKLDYIRGDIIINPGETVDVIPYVAKFLLDKYPKQLRNVTNFNKIIDSINARKKKIGAKEHIVDNPNSVEYK